MAKDELGDRMKSYEEVEAKRLLTGGPVCARIDGRSFSKFTRGFEKPHDNYLAGAMRAACRVLVEKTNANIGFVQSDEISLVWDQPAEGSQMIFNGRAQKLTSVLASLTTISFAEWLTCTHADLVWQRMPHFDARVWTVPSQIEATNVLVWRSQDARKNGISSAARANMSAKQMHGLNQQQMVEAMEDRGVDYYSQYPRHHQFGTFYRRRNVMRTLTEKEWRSIPEEHRPAPSTTFMRSEVIPLDIRYFADVENRVDVVFAGSDPIFCDSRCH